MNQRSAFDRVFCGGIFFQAREKDSRCRTNNSGPACQVKAVPVNLRNASWKLNSRVCKLATVPAHTCRARLLRPLS